MCRRDSLSLRRLAVLSAFMVLILGYVFRTGLDHLHLHVDRQHAFAHDHLHIGYHDHDLDHDHHHDQNHESDPIDKQPGDDGSEQNRRGVTVLTSAQGAHVVPARVAIHSVFGSLAELPWFHVGPNVRRMSLHPSWGSRAPPS